MVFDMAISTILTGESLFGFAGTEKASNGVDFITGRDF